MATAESSVATFSDHLSEYDVSMTRVQPEQCKTAIAEAIDPPAVGVPLPFAEATLPEAVETEPTAAQLRAAETGVTAAALGIADYGSVVLESDAAGTEPVSLFNTRHVVVLRRSDIVAGMADAIDWFATRARDDQRSAIIATGPSATADMGSLVMGAHGPEVVDVILIEDADRAVSTTPSEGDTQ